MAYRSRFLFIALATVGIASVSLAPTGAFAKKAKASVPHTAQVVTPGPAVVPDSNIPADRVPRCFDSVIHYPSAAPCY